MSGGLFTSSTSAPSITSTNISLADLALTLNLYGQQANMANATGAAFWLFDPLILTPGRPWSP